MTPQQEQMLRAAVLSQTQGPIIGNPYVTGAPANPYVAPAPKPAPDPRYAQAAQSFDQESTDIAAQRALANAVQKQSTEAPGLITAGNVSVAGANPMTALAQGLNAWTAGRMNKAADEESSVLKQSRATKEAAVAGLAEEEIQREIDAATSKVDFEERKLALDEANTKADNDRADRQLAQALKIAELNQDRQDARSRAAIDAKNKRASDKAQGDENTSGISNIITAADEGIAKLDKDGKSSSGVAGIVVDASPEVLKGLTENLLFDKEERKQRAQNSYIDSQVKEAITTGVLSNQDVQRLAGLNIGSGGLTNEQQQTRLKAINEIMAKYDMVIDPSGVKEEPDDAETAPVAAPATEQTATNPQTGEVLVLRNGQWVKK